MNYIIIISIFFSTTISPLFAKKIPGQIIRQKDTLQVTFDIPTKMVGGQISFDKIQNEVTFYSKNISKTLLPEDSVAFQFEYEGETIKFASVDNTLKLGGKFTKNDKIFLRILVDEPLKIYRYYYFSNKPGGITANQQMETGERNPLESMYIIQQVDKELIKIQERSFQKDMKAYFADCTDLFNLIENKEITANDINKLLYNFKKYCLND